VCPVLMTFKVGLARKVSKQVGRVQVIRTSLLGPALQPLMIISIGVDAR
jgi:hypothetical protein